MILSRARALALLGSSVALVRCGPSGPSVRVGSKNFTESILIAEIYAKAAPGQRTVIVHTSNGDSATTARINPTHFQESNAEYRMNDINNNVRGTMIAR